MDEVAKKTIPTAVTIAPVLKLIKYHQEGDQQAFMDAARELDLNGEQELMLYILAQFKLVDTWVPQ
jgi:hypothetical protein